MGRNRPCGYYTPTALGFSRTKRRPYSWIGLGHATGMRYLIETIWRCDRANRYWVKKYLVVWVDGQLVGTLDQLFEVIVQIS